jgi:hypothetical protein
MSQLAAAIKACYLEGGDFLDSSKYDDCNGVPRYAKGRQNDDFSVHVTMIDDNHARARLFYSVSAGLLEWWEDLEKEYVQVHSTLASGIAGQESAHYSEAMTALQVRLITLRSACVQ